MIKSCSRFLRIKWQDFHQWKRQGHLAEDKERVPSQQTPQRLSRCEDRSFRSGQKTPKWTYRAFACQFLKDTFITNNRTGCAFVTVDALKEAIPFYQKNGFKFWNQARLKTLKKTPFRCTMIWRNYFDGLMDKMRNPPHASSRKIAKYGEVGIRYGSWPARFPIHLLLSREWI